MKFCHFCHLNQFSFAFVLDVTFFKRKFGTSSVEANAELADNLVFSHLESIPIKIKHCSF